VYVQIIVILAVPKKLKRKLKRQAKKLKLNEKKTNAYIYGTIKKIEKAKGKKRTK
jgi:hypothetical protein